MRLIGLIILEILDLLIINNKDLITLSLELGIGDSLESLKEVGYKTRSNSFDVRSDSTYR